MDSEERLLRAFRCQEVDRMPVVPALIDPYDRSNWMSQTPEYAPVIEAAKRADIMARWSPAHSIHDLFQGLVVRGRTLTKERVSAEAGHYSKITKYPIETEDDFHALLQAETCHVLQDLRGLDLSVPA